MFMRFRSLTILRHVIFGMFILAGVLILSTSHSIGHGQEITGTPTLSPTETVIPTNTSTSMVTPELVEAALIQAQDFSGGNTDWKPFVQTFDGVEMVLVPAGCFEMGSTGDETEVAFHQCETTYGTGKCDRVWFEAEVPAHQVCFEEPFWLDRYEVTNGQFAAFNGQAGHSAYHSGDDRPRELITWTEANTFCENREARLPTEAEWEYAARGPDAWKYPWGNEFDGSEAIWNQNDDGTAPVGSLPSGASWVGALDMSGNVWEWIADWYDASYYANQPDGVVNPTGPMSGDYRVLRGGSWWNILTDFLRTANRSKASPDNLNGLIGFRCARSVAG